MFYVTFYKSYSGVKILEWISENGKSSFVKWIIVNQIDKLYSLLYL